MSDIADRIKELNEKIGPRKIETPDLKTEDHSLKDLMELERAQRACQVPLFSNFAMTKVVPKGGCGCEVFHG